MDGGGERPRTLRDQWRRWVRLAAASSGDIDPTDPADTGRVILRITALDSRGGRRLMHYDLVHFESFVEDDTYDDVQGMLGESMGSAEIVLQRTEEEGGNKALYDVTDDVRVILAAQ